MTKLNLIICPGVHAPQLTSSFIQRSIKQDCSILPTERYLPYNAIAIAQWLKTIYSSPIDTPPLSFITFSAGVVGGIGAANIWQMQGGKIAHFVAFDGWGVPLIANFPIYRISHDYFTHWSSSILGRGKSSFYAEPGIEHLDLWRSPNTCWGWETVGGFRIRYLLTDYLSNILDS